MLNPAAVKAVIDTSGGSVVAGLRHFAADVAAPPRIPSMVEPDAFKVGAEIELALSAWESVPSGAFTCSELRSRLSRATVTDRFYPRLMAR